MTRLTSFSERQFFNYPYINLTSSPYGAGYTWANNTNFKTAMGANSEFSIVWGKNQFVATGSSARCLTSSDGVNWTYTSSLSDAVGNFVIYNMVWTGSQYIAVGVQSVAATSSDGINWTSQTTNFRSAMGGSIYTAYSIATSGSVSVAVGSGFSAGAVGVYSTDGVNWTTNTSSLNPALGSKSTANFVIWTGNKFMAFASNTSPYVPSIATSYDGINWTNPGTFPTSSYYPMSAASNGNSILTVGSTSASQRGTIAYLSSDGGNTWSNITSQLTSTFNTTTGTGVSVTWNGKAWVVIGTGSPPAVSLSTDGNTWVSANPSANLLPIFGSSDFLAGSNYNNTAAYSNTLNMIVSLGHQQGRAAYSTS